ncbi:endonuclease/exonuclease/phosphatase family protein [Leucobacter coleopterorum]|uniref:Endonuclease/exonuclease/phosphatase family protein n=1 Tax=Leucobacter coleopterorum TaxID=2714933 RepID=A0ABX6JXJ8_9MICO|nr:endonuclease/exonuclease/phosphatase family protein [Leucobacter coleopterorum]QIM19047.1 endonuclease/exonuclease/phosphatase family protein [Leucobacter coleopterorum]
MWFVALLAVTLTLLVVLHPFVHGSLGTIIATSLPWLGWILPLLGIGALLSRSKRAWIFVVLPTLVWAAMVGSVLIPIEAAGADTKHQLTVASHNVEGNSHAAAQSARDLVAAGAEVIALVELAGNDREAADAELAESHPYSYTVGTVGLWSVYPLDLEQSLDLGLGWKRALSADVITPSGTVSVYVVHAASFRPGDQHERDTMLQSLGALIPKDQAKHLIVMGDFNAATFDPAMATILETVEEPHQSDLSWGFTWPTEFPAARIDHILVRGFTPLENHVLSAGNSDHKAVLATLQFD